MTLKPITGKMGEVAIPVPEQVYRCCRDGNRGISIPTPGHGAGRLDRIPSIWRELQSKKVLLKNKKQTNSKRADVFTVSVAFGADEHFGGDSS